VTLLSEPSVRALPRSCSASRSMSLGSRIASESLNAAMAATVALYELTRRITPA